MNAAERALENRRLLLRLSLAAVVMFGFGFALVPFYKAICEITGVNRVAQPAAGAALNTQIDRSREVLVQFDANTRGLPWRFSPDRHSIKVHPGQLVQVEYELENVTARALTGQAVPSYGPLQAGQYFRKIDCFCFTQQHLAAGEKRKMPVVFVLDPALPAEVNVITLSYTFFEVEGRAAQAAQAKVKG